MHRILAKRTFSLFTSFMVFTVVLFASCQADVTPLDNDAFSDRTVIFYIAAHNSLHSWQEADMQEMIEGATQLQRNQKMVLLIDRPTETAIYVLTRFSGLHPLPVHRFAKNQDMADAATLSNLLSWVRQHHPARSYGMVLWSHADGWLPPISSTPGSVRTARSFVIDVGIGGDAERDHNVYQKIGYSMQIEDLAAALKHSEMHFDYLFFDACLMQGLEVCYALRHAADYIVGAPMFIPAVGAYYAHLVPRGLFSADVSDIARTYYDDANDPKLPALDVQNYKEVGLVISVVRTAPLDSLARLTHRLFLQTTLQGIEPNMDGVQAYLAYVYAQFYRPDYYDAGVAMSRILSPAAYAMWREQYDKCIVYKRATPTFYAYDDYFTIDEDTYTGVSMFVPQSKYTQNANNCIFGDLNELFRHTAWYRDAGWQSLGW